MPLIFILFFIAIVAMIMISKRDKEEQQEKTSIRETLNLTHAKEDATIINVQSHVAGTMKYPKIQTVVSFSDRTKYTFDYAKKDMTRVYEDRETREQCIRAAIQSHNKDVEQAKKQEEAKARLSTMK